MQIDTVGIVFFDGAGRITDCNDAFLRMSGLVRDDVQQRRVGWESITAPEWIEASARALADFRERSRVQPFEKQHVRRDGSRWWALFAATRLGPDEGVAYVIDVTDRKLAEAARRATEAEFRAMFELSSVGQCQAELATGAIVRANPRFCTMVGYPAATLTQMRVEELIHPDDRAAMAAMLDALLVGGVHETSFAARLVHANGGLVWVEGNVTLMREDGGAPLRMAAIVRDVSVQRQTEQALAESRERLRLVVDSAREYAILSMDLGRRITSWNPGAEQITGYSAAEMLGQSADILFTPDDRLRGEADHEANRALTTGRAANERWHQRKDGSRFWGSGVLMAMLDAQQRPVGLVKIFRDETEARQWSESLKQSRAQLWEALRENERAREQLQAASRAKDHFLTVLSHELRTPLTPVLMAAQALGMRDDLPADVRPALEMIQRNVRIEAHFIEDLLDLTRMSRGELEIAREPTDLHATVGAAIEAVRPVIEDKRIALDLELGAEHHTLDGDGARLQQAVANVLKNAAKFTGHGGHIWLHTESAGPMFRLTVRDDGIGIGREYLDGIFDAFSQAGEWVARAYGGLGLGLALAKASVEAHGGSIQASSAGKDQGTTLTIQLPLPQ
jgi:two-component system CheB/CheR fusion protein